MSAIYFLISCSVIIALIFLIAFFWASKSGQHDDTYTPAMRILFDDELVDIDEESIDSEKSGQEHIM